MVRQKIAIRIFFCRFVFTSINAFSQRKLRMQNDAVYVQFSHTIQKGRPPMILISIVGDSISTFEGYSLPGYSVFYNKEKQSLNGLTSVYDTWWAQVNRSLHAFLCVNNSYSGSRVSGKTFPAASSVERLSKLRTPAYSPDLILVYIGFNDFGQGIKISHDKFSFSMKRDPSLFEDAYEVMIDIMKAHNPEAKIICGTLLRTTIKENDNWVFPEAYLGIPFESYNEAIRRAAKKKKVELADLSALDLRYETLDGTHPTAKGHQTIAQAWLKCLADINATGPSIETCIRMYNANKEMDHTVYAVFSALAREKVVMPFNTDDKLTALQFKNSSMIPLFTSPNEIPKDEPVRIKVVYLRDYIDILLQAQMSVIVNPFSEPDLQFIIPYPAINRMLKPVIDSKA